MQDKINLSGLDIADITKEIQAIGAKAFRAKQLYNWIYVKGETNFANMTNLSKDFRNVLEDSFVIKRPEIVKQEISKDGTRKWLLAMDDGQEVEAVFIPEEDRGALCVSTQVGCNMACKFCHTGTMRVTRNLTYNEIVNQLLVAKDSYNDWIHQSDDARMVSNIVVMGMGEPLENYDETARALKLAMHGDGIAISKRRITLSTCGIVPKIYQCGEELGVNLAISLHASNDELRKQIMPISYKYPLAEVMKALKKYPAASNSRRITVEYILIDKLNDSIEHAKELVEICKNIPVKFNLIPFNPWEGSIYKPSSKNAQRRFSAFLNDAGFSAPIRVTRGNDISAACGQLKTKKKLEI